MDVELLLADVGDLDGEEGLAHLLDTQLLHAALVVIQNVNSVVGWLVLRDVARHGGEELVLAPLEGSGDEDLEALDVEDEQGE